MSLSCRHGVGGSRTRWFKATAQLRRPLPLSSQASPRVWSVGGHPRLRRTALGVGVPTPGRLPLVCICGDLTSKQGHGHRYQGSDKDMAFGGTQFHPECGLLEPARANGTQGWPRRSFAGWWGRSTRHRGLRPGEQPSTAGAQGPRDARTHVAGAVASPCLPGDRRTNSPGSAAGGRPGLCPGPQSATPVTALAGGPRGRLQGLQVHASRPAARPPSALLPPVSRPGGAASVRHGRHQHRHREKSGPSDKCLLVHARMGPPRPAEHREDAARGGTARGHSHRTASPDPRHAGRADNSGFCGGGCVCAKTHPSGRLHG